VGTVKESYIQDTT
jgi:hypothetical protein